MKPRVLTNIPCQHFIEEECRIILSCELLFYSELNKRSLVILGIMVAAVISLSYLMLGLAAIFTQDSHDDKLVGEPLKFASKETSILYVHVVTEEGKPLEGEKVYARPLNSSTPTQCIWEPGKLPRLRGQEPTSSGAYVPNGTIYKLDGRILFPNGTEIFSPCTWKILLTNGTGWSTIAGRPGHTTHYSVWIDCGHFCAVSDVVPVYANKTNSVTLKMPRR